MNRRFLSGSLIVGLALSGGLVLGAPADTKPKKPSLNVRVSPRVAFSPVNVVASAELKGGEDSEEFYCLGIEWDWGDGSRSVRNSDCEPFEPGTKIERRFSSSHYYGQAGSYNIRATLRTAKKTIAVDSFRLQVRQGIPGDSRRPDGSAPQP